MNIGTRIIWSALSDIQGTTTDALTKRELNYIKLLVEQFEGRITDEDFTTAADAAHKEYKKMSPNHPWIIQEFGQVIT